VRTEPRNGSISSDEVLLKIVRSFCNRTMSESTFVEFKDNATSVSV